ncbi:acyl-CoA dehydrogenase [Halogeometricum borinquense]|uniref:acyl-CoA dehydrogenase n=1 Tax=Halogeometricum borinquense TaxID=60847 RepID=UPI00342B02AF
MSNFKSGSGNLDFGGGDDEEDETATETANTQTKEADSTTEQPTQPESEESVSDTERSSNQSAAEESTASSPADKYPYFVRRSNVGDERDTRLEIHVRDKVADQEAAFRSELAEQLGTNEVSKTDAREFALLMAYQHPDRVAELMQDEGFGTLG